MIVHVVNLIQWIAHPVRTRRWLRSTVRTLIKRGYDVHTHSALFIFGNAGQEEREIAKKVNMTMAFGGDPQRVLNNVVGAVCIEVDFRELEMELAELVA